MTRPKEYIERKIERRKWHCDSTNACFSLKGDAKKYKEKFLERRPSYNARVLKARGKWCVFVIGRWRRKKRK